jgi:hypothetical protein
VGDVTIGAIAVSSCAALLAAARIASDSVRYDSRGYASRWQENLMIGLPLAEIAQDLGGGAGRELDGKFCAAHSSAALAVNTFGPWRTAPAGLSISGHRGFQSLRFEASCPTGLGGTPPHLDLLAEGKTIIAVESKRTEWMDPKPACFSASYDRLRSSHGRSPWFELIPFLRVEPNHYDFIDAAQLVKHALGLLTCYGGREVLLVYLFWEPRNSANWQECVHHRNEADDLANRVNGCSVRLRPMSYREIWAEWKDQGTTSHSTYVHTRYDLLV